jgi:hypothetical protein
VRRFFRSKALRFGADGGDACGCRNTDVGAVVVTFSSLKLRVKTLDHAISTMAARCVVSLLGGFIVELRVPRSRFAVFGGKFWLSV